MRLTFDISNWERKIQRFPVLARTHIDKAFYKLIKNARLAMNSRIEDFPSHTNELLLETLQQYGIDPRPGELRNALEDSMEKGTKTRKYVNKYTRKIIDIDKLDSLTPWGGVGGRRPIQSPKNWKTNPYPSHGFWKTYNDGFTWDKDTRIYGRNFIDLGERYIRLNFKHEIRLAMRRILYHLGK